MKRIFTYSVISIMSFVFLAACTKGRIYNPDESYWLSQERGEVIYSDIYCNYYVVQTYNGYNIVRSYGGYKPFEGSIVYGNFSFSGTRDFYNRSSGVIFTGTVTDYWLSYNGALDAIDYYCPLYGKTSSTSGFRSGLKPENK
ncbi:MAG: hypothetical protein ABUL41_01470 [Chitinophagaceae bacterium]